MKCFKGAFSKFSAVTKSIIITSPVSDIFHTYPCHLYIKPRCMPINKNIKSYIT